MDSRKLLLRIYGPQTGDLIDREVELQILKRLAQKSIGPRMLGTFTNGRFEQYFNARTLTAQDIRQPGTSMQIAKRMRELHDGIDLLEEERSAGPSIWQNWDKLVQRCEGIMRWIDQETSKSEQKPMKPLSEAWMRRGFVCGVPWPLFRQTVHRYRTWLSALYGDSAAIARDLIFAHNDVSEFPYGRLVTCQRLIATPDAIWQSPSPGAWGRVTATYTRQRAQTASCHRFRICIG